MRDFDVAIVGAGVIGLACAAELARRSQTVVVIERQPGVAREISARNSGVIHAGLYYPPNSLKARLCVEGRTLLYERCRSLGIPHVRTGKLIVATDHAQVPQLESLRDNAERSGVEALAIVDSGGVRALEPHVRAVAGLVSPDTGIVDAHALCESYRAEAQSLGALLVLNTEVTALDAGVDRMTLHTLDTLGRTSRVRAGAVVVAAGLSADRVAELAGLDIEAMGLRQRPCKGDYFRLATRHRGLVSRPIYPLPGTDGLGIHVTVDLAGTLRAGPDAHYVDTPALGVDPTRQGAFGKAVRCYLPDVRDADLCPDFAGIRPKLASRSGAPRDFHIGSAAAQGMPRLVCLLGIESPGLTASAAIARRVASLVDAALDADASS